MSRTTDIISHIQRIADTGSAETMAALGSPGKKVTIDGEKWETGAVWTVEPPIFETLIDGIAAYLDDFKKEIVEEVG